MRWGDESRVEKWMWNASYERHESGWTTPKRMFSIKKAYRAFKHPFFSYVWWIVFYTSLLDMEFNDSMNYLEFWELGVESVGSHIEPESSSIRKRSPDIFTDSSSEEEETDLYPKQAAILNQLHEMMKVEQDVVNIFIMDSIRKLLTTRSSSTSRDLFYKCPLNITINKFYRKVSWLLLILRFIDTNWSSMVGGFV